MCNVLCNNLCTIKSFYTSFVGNKIIELNSPNIIPIVDEIIVVDNEKWRITRVSRIYNYNGKTNDYCLIVKRFI
jgi:hypothetical protein